MRGTIPVPAKDVHIFEKHFETFLEYVTQTDILVHFIWVVVY